MPTVPIYYLFIALGLFLILAAFLYKTLQQYHELKIDYYTQKLRLFEQKAKEVTNLVDAKLLLQQCKSIIPQKFYLNNNLEKIVVSTIINKIKLTTKGSQLFSIIGDIVHKSESDCEVILWKKVKFEVLSHLEAVSKLNEHDYWLKRIIDSKT